MADSEGMTRVALQTGCSLEIPNGVRIVELEMPQASSGAWNTCLAGQAVRFSWCVGPLGGYCDAGPGEWHVDEEDEPTTQALQAETATAREELKRIEEQQRKLQAYRDTVAADVRYFETTLRIRRRVECSAS